MSARKGGTRTDRRAAAIAVGSPALAVADEEREAVADLLAEILIAASLEPHTEASTP